jgi:hypothetical protein
MMNLSGRPDRCFVADDVRSDTTAREEELSDPCL